MNEGFKLGGSSQAGGFLVISVTLALLGCSDKQASKSWSALAVCVVGDAAKGPAADRMKQLRAIQLSNSGSAGKGDAWPARCATYANQLYAALDS